MQGSIRRKTMVCLGVAAAILAPVVQQLGRLGLSQAEFAAQGDATLRAAGYAFSIWGLIYLALAVYAIRYARKVETLALRILAGPAALAVFGCALWIVAASANLMGLTVALILVSAGAAITGLLQTAPLATNGDRPFALWPVALLAGWLTVAAPLNILTALTAMGVIQPEALWALIAVALVVIVGAGVAWRARSWVYPLPIAWGLGGVYAAERLDKPDIALAAAGAGALLIAAGIVAARRR